MMMLNACPLGTLHTDNVRNSQITRPKASVRELCLTCRIPTPKGKVNDGTGPRGGSWVEKSSHLFQNTSISTASSMYICFACILCMYISKIQTPSFISNREMPIFSRVATFCNHPPKKRETTVKLMLRKKSFTLPDHLRNDQRRILMNKLF